MKRLGAIGIGLIAIYIFLAAFAGPVVDGIKGVRAESRTDTANVTTGVGVTTGSVNLTYNLYQEILAEVQSITSTDEDDTPVAGTYTDATKVLLVTGLDDDTTRILTVNYHGETEQSVMRVIGPFMAIAIFGIVIGGILWSMFKGRG